ncbi:DivIVA domain-containing protein [Oscillospiraceae bacterium CM]|nr:DivIVA domain-containing protein [Oscillospiraceae bacterium CM]
MLTPQEISGKEFVKAVFGGYDMSVVDDFLETLTADYTALYKENAILKSKIKVLVEKVEEYRTTDDAMRMALLTAQKLGDEITTDAKKKSDDMIRQTENDIRDRLLEMKSKYADEDARLLSVKDETKKYIQASQEILKQHAAFLSRIEELSTGKSSSAAYEPNDEPVCSPAAEDEPSESDISTTARQIDSALSNLTETDTAADPFAPMFKDGETAKLFRPKHENDPPEDDEPTSPRPKFDFNDLKFGSNYAGE